MENFDAIDEMLERARIDYETNPRTDDDLSTILVQNVLKCIEAIRKKYPKSNKFISDTMECPVCKTGILAFFISDHVNGHIHGECSNHANGCVKWMQ